MDMDIEDIAKFPRKYNKAYFKKNAPDVYDSILKCSGETFAEKLYAYIHGPNPGCIVCGKPTRFLGLSKGYAKTCSVECSGRSPERLNKIKQTNLDRYGVENASSNDDVKKKRAQTFKERYNGIGTASTAINHKIVNTNLDRYGVENASSNDEVKKKRTDTFTTRYGGYGMGSGTISDKIKQTNLDRYGVENPMGLQVFRDKAAHTIMDRYGVPNIMLSCEFLENWSSPWASEAVRQKSKETLYRHYGVENPMQSEIIKSKALRQMIDNLKVKHDYLLDIVDGIWICKCPHPECNKCVERCFETYSNIQHTRIDCNAETCTKLHPIGVAGDTNIEIFIENILKDLGVVYVKHDRTLLQGKEIDFYIPSKNIAIECNGLRFHSTSSNQTISKPKNYHLNKFKQLKSIGIQLISIWEDWILTKPHIVKNLLHNKLAPSPNVIYARKCTIKEIDKDECDEFLESYHIQGTCKSKYRYGLFYEDLLVSVMTFGRRLVATPNDWELLRYCCKPDYTVIGGTGKLLKHFIKDINPDMVVSFSSNDISIGNVYKTLGFAPTKDIQQSYWYVDKKTLRRYHRTKFTKKQLRKLGYDGTEFEIMDQLPYWRIYDSGTIRWELKKESL